MTSFATLIRIEFRRVFTVTVWILVGLLTLMNGLIAFLISRMGETVSALQVSESSLSTLLNFGIPILAVGIIANDLKDHWLRSLLVRPATRTGYLFARLLAVYAVYAMMVFISIWPMTFLIGLTLGKDIEWSSPILLQLTGLSMSHGLLVLMLATLFSVWLPGISNIVVLALWALAGVTAGDMIGSMYWDSAFISTAVTFIFPSGFLDAIDAVKGEREGVLAGVLWGLAALSMSTALTMWSLNRKTIDTGSE